MHLYPDKSFLVEGLAEMQAKTGRKAQVLAKYRRLLALDPGTPTARYVNTHVEGQAAATRNAVHVCNGIFAMRA